MTDAYVMLNCELGAEAEIIEKLKELEEVKDVFETIGTHDMMVKLQADNFEKIREIVSWNIQKLPKVRSTATLIKKNHDYQLTKTMTQETISLIFSKLSACNFTIIS